jgi:sigma-54 dependent transcriptional regulator, acetoin dehydrogenase operon transcriptional activator AcoR
MNPGSPPFVSHDHVLDLRGDALPPEGRPHADILDSWVRCHHGGLDMADTPMPDVAGAVELARRRTHAEYVRRLAQAELETLATQIAGSNFLLAFADQDGVILDTYADNRFSMSSSGPGIVVGSRWSEALCGTNGLGTALALGQPVAVSGLEHYLTSLGDIFCTAAPVRDASGAIVGVLDASSYYESRQRHTQALVQMAATHMENQLLAHQMRQRTLLAIHPRAEFLGTLSAGLLAFDGEGRLRAANARSRQLLTGLALEAGTSFEALFGEPLDHCLARLYRQPDTRLRDVLGSTLVTALVSPRAAASLPRPLLPAPERTPPPSVSPPPMASVQGAPTMSELPRRPPQRPAPAPTAEPLTDSPFVADDPAVAQACQLVRAAVRMKAPILIHGDTGTGKELMARHAHTLSGRRGPFVAVNCGALPAELVEAELFGYVGGAFSGARAKGSPGLIASADGGTLLLDELGELPLALQPALLRFLDDHTVRPVGGVELRHVDVQLLAATHVDLAVAVAERRFRADLLYRLNTVRVTLPTLRQRHDFAQAARHMLAGLDAGMQLDDGAIARLARHDWPGNFRELRSVLTRALLTRASALPARRDPVLTAADFEGCLPGGAEPPPTASALQSSAAELVRREHERFGGNVSRTAQALGISRTTVYRHLRAGGVVPG